MINTGYNMIVVMCLVIKAFQRQIVVSALYEGIKV